MVTIPSPYGVSFILIEVTLAEYKYTPVKGFPSPYGVSFILIKFCFPLVLKDLYLFPSPYGVSFIFIYPCFTKTSAKREFPSPCGVLFILII